MQSCECTNSVGLQHVKCLPAIVKDFSWVAFLGTWTRMLLQKTKAAVAAAAQ